MVRPERWNLNSKAFLLIFYLWKHRWLVEYGEWWLHVVLSSCLSEDWENELSPAWCRWNLNTSHHQRHHLQVHPQNQSPRHRPEWYKIKESAKNNFLNSIYLIDCFTLYIQTLLQILFAQNFKSRFRAMNKLHHIPNKTKLKVECTDIC